MTRPTRTLEKMTPEQQQLALDNQGLIGLYFKRYPLPPGYDADDADAEAKFLLCEAARRFQKERKSKFSTYAYTYIRLGMLTWRQEYATISQLISGAAQSKVQLFDCDTPSRPSSGFTAENVVDDAVDATDTLVTVDHASQLLSVLPDLHRQMVETRFGLGEHQLPVDGATSTPTSKTAAVGLPDVAKKFGTSYQRVQRILRNAMYRMRVFAQTGHAPPIVQATTPQDKRKNSLGPVRLKVLRFLHQRIVETGYPPVQVEVAKHINASLSVAARHVQSLCSLGYIEKSGPYSTIKILRHDWLDWPQEG